MNKMMSMEAREKYRENINNLFGKFASDDLYEVEITGEKKATIYYYGTADIEVLRRECEEALFSAMGPGEEMEVKIVKKSKDNVSKPKVKKNLGPLKIFAGIIIALCIVSAVVVIIYNYIVNRNFKESFYSISSIKVDGPVRIIQLSDTHGAFYGKDNEKLFERIEALKPDIIIHTGDIVDSAKDDVEYAVNLAKGLSKIAPSYCIYGNNEVETIYEFVLNKEELDEKFGFDDDNRDETALLKIEDSFEKELENAGIKVLKNEMDTIQLGTTAIDVYGVLTSNPSAFWPYSAKALEGYLYKSTESFKIFAVHEPFVFEVFEEVCWGDLMLCGHTHGGVVRIPGIGALLTYEGGLFPEKKNHYVYGRYDISGMPLIVNSGLENASIFRINNQPELVIIDINKF